ncbi:hypothetical protein [Crenothrix polyspora]|uniref:Uncharacterized protein n=1 Tax=Crenothrix polyspora TaxID=360316 RepID=A0A1R4H947_9GAMM|nr:hypothetical protein [Crenothrix polyspora]SJM92706.1 exported hypothetical protein [Crenothrix polyspora]
MNYALKILCHTVFLQAVVLTPIYAQAAPPPDEPIPQGVLTIKSSGNFTNTTASSFKVASVVSNTLLSVSPSNSDIIVPISGNYIATTTVKTCISGSRNYVSAFVNLNKNVVADAMNLANECGSAVATASIYARAGEVISGKCAINQGISSSCSFSLAFIN